MKMASMKNQFLFLCFFSFFISTLGLSESPKLHIVTVASHETKGLQILRASCERYQLKLHVIGMGNPFPGVSYNLYACEQFAEQLPKNDVVMFVDAFDVIFQANENQILRTFFGMNRPFVIAAERFCYPFPQLARLFPSETSFRYINSGTYIGYADHVADVLRGLRPYDFIWNDQGLLTLDFVQNGKKYCLDHFCELFFPLAGVVLEDVMIDDEKGLVHCLETGTTPCVIHGNGSGKGLYHHISDKFYKRP